MNQRKAGYQCQVILLCLAVSTIMLRDGRANEPRELGLTRERPAKGRFVETERGFMVSYRATIPGTDISFEMIPVPAGVVKMSAKLDVKLDEPVDVPIKPFWIGRYEVTVAEYKRYMSLHDAFMSFSRLRIRPVTEKNQLDAVTAPSMLYDWKSYFPDAPESQWPSHPAVGMTHYAAKQYTKWLSKLTDDFYRLPSEAEWEYACRAGATTVYSFGNDPQQLGDYAWHRGNSRYDTHPVGKKRPNRWGLYDMHGNAAEWVLDQYSEGYAPLRQAVAEGKFTVHWPTKLHPRTVRGGSWDEAAVACRCTARVGSSVEWHEEEPMLPVSPHWLASSMQRRVGFRIIRPLDPPKAPGEHGRFWDADVDELRKTIEAYFESNYTYQGIVDPKLPAALKRLEK